MFRFQSRQQQRLDDGGQINRLAPINFTFDGKKFIGFEGDTLASALLANGVRLVGRSFKYHRPRGIYSAGIEEPNALVALRSGDRHEPNTRATAIELFPGLEAKSQNRWPNLLLDYLQINNLLSPFLSAGFYYKTFMGLPGWHFYEYFIRKAAGMGDGTKFKDPDKYDKKHVHCDILIVGGGPTGISAAVTAGRAGARVILVDNHPKLGGQLNGERYFLDKKPAHHWVEQCVEELDGLENVTIATRTSAFGYYDSDVVNAIESVSDHLPEPLDYQCRQRLWQIRAKKVILATGATERPIVFSNNDRPGIMLASAARRYVNQYAVRPGKKAVIFTNNDDGYKTAFDLARSGVEVVAVVDSRKNIPEHFEKELNEKDIEVIASSVVIDTYGYFGLNSVKIGTLSHDGKTIESNPYIVSADLLAVSGGWSPNVHLYCHSGGKPVYNDSIEAFVPGELSQNGHSAGASRGSFSLTDCLQEGHNIANTMAKALNLEVAEQIIPETNENTIVPIEALWRVPGKGKKFVDLQDDVTESDITLAHREGYVSVEHLKRYTTLGMGTDQGKTSNLNGQAIMAQEKSEPIEKIGTTTFRPPYTPIALGPLAGRDIGLSYKHTRRSAMHNWHKQNGAIFVEAGQWLRPQYYLNEMEQPSKENMDKAISREVQTVRTSVGLVDVSTLGKIDIQGKDSAEFLNRVYTNGWTKLPIGKARYGIMLREDGLVFDDGTTSRLDECHYFMTTTTSNAAAVLSHMEYYLQVQWPELDVKVTSVTEQWAAMALAGPKSRNVLSKLLPTINVDNESFPFMGVREVDIEGVPARIFRISFSGELSYEINVPADFGEFIWQRILDVGKAYSIRPYGTEAMGIMRIEKGHVAGPELDGRTTATDLGLQKLLSSKKDFIGSKMMDREGLKDENRPRLVGLVPVDKKSRVKSGAILVKDPTLAPPVPKLGHVSSSAYLSPTLGHPISLGFVSGDIIETTKKIWAVSPLHNESHELEITDPVFYDQKSERLHD